MLRRHQGKETHLLTTPQILPPLFLFLFLFLLLFLLLFLISQSSGIEVRGTIGGALSRMQGRGAGATTYHHHLFTHHYHHHQRT